jgi:chromosome partitioning protein
MSGTKHFVPVVAVLNMKGGVGKTTISAHVFRVLFQRRRAGTLLIDLDPQFNLTQTLFTRERYDAIKKDNRTILTVMEPPPEVGLFEVRTSTLPPPSIRDVTWRFYKFRASKPPKYLAIVPGDFKLVKYSLMDDNRKLKSVKDRFDKFVQSALRKARNEQSII